MSIFQLGSVLFGLFMLYVVSIHKRKSSLSAAEVSFWYSTWILFILLSLFPQVLTGIAGILRFARVFDLLIVGAFMVLTTVLITSYLKQKELQSKLEQLVRQRAIDDSKKN